MSNNEGGGRPRALSPAEVRAQKTVLLVVILLLVLFCFGLILSMALNIR